VLKSSWLLTACDPVTEIVVGRQTISLLLLLNIPVASLLALFIMFCVTVILIAT
jgi:hypothetical protein